jgi:hypothetical protein
MAAAKQYNQALAFCRQAALLEPNLAKPYVNALAYAELAKDSKSMEWAAGRLVSQDWLQDNVVMHEQATSRLDRLASTLAAEQRGSEADRLKAALRILQERDLKIVLTWDTPGGDSAGLELQVKEPMGGVCSLAQRQTPGGGILTGGTLTEPTRVTYLAAQGFSGDYEITVRRLWGQTIGSKARLEIIQHVGAPNEKRHIEVIRLDQPGSAIKVSLGGGRRAELATVPAADLQKRNEAREEARPRTALDKLRALAFGDFSGATGGAPRAGAGAGATPRVNGVAAAAKIDAGQQSAVQGGAVPITGQLRASNQDNGLDMVLRPVFQNLPGGRSTFNLPGIPGGQ